MKHFQLEGTHKQVEMFMRMGKFAYDEYLKQHRETLWRVGTMICHLVGIWLLLPKRVVPVTVLKKRDLSFSRLGLD